MTYNDISSHPLRPFPNFISVSKAKDLSIIPENYFSMFADNCPCGSERMVRLHQNGTSITAVTCVDPRCPFKLKFQVNDVFDKFGYKGIGPQTCGRIVWAIKEELGYVSLYEVLVNGPKYCKIGDSAEDDFIGALRHIEQSKLNLGTFISYLSYPLIGSKFEDIFRGISTITEFTELATSEGGLISFLSKRGVRSIDVIFYLVHFLKEIEQLYLYFEKCIISSSTNIVPICMTGRMVTSHGAYTKADYLYHCNLLAMTDDGDKLYDVISVDTISKASFVIAGADSIAKKTTKYRNAVDREEFLKKSGYISENDKFLFSPDEFFLYLLNGGEHSE